MAGKPFAVVPLELPAIVTGNAAATNPVTNLNVFDLINATWKSIGNTNLYVRIDFGANAVFDVVSLLGTNAQSGTTIRIRAGDSQAEVDGAADYDSGVVQLWASSGLGAKTFYHSMNEIPQQTKRWLRIDIGSHTGDFEAGVLVVGKKIQPSRFYETAYDRGVDDLGSVDFTRNGTPLKLDGAKLRTLTFQMSWITEAEMETSFRPLDEAVGLTGEVLWVFDPDAGSYRHDRMYYGYQREKSSITKRAYNMFQKEFSIVSMI